MNTLNPVASAQLQEALAEGTRTFKMERMYQIWQERGLAVDRIGCLCAGTHCHLESE